MSFPKMQPTTSDLLAVIALLMAKVDAAALQACFNPTYGQLTFSNEDLEHGRSCGPCAQFNEQGELVVRCES